MWIIFSLIKSPGAWPWVSCSASIHQAFSVGWQGIVDKNFFIELIIEVRLSSAFDNFLFRGNGTLDIFIWGNDQIAEIAVFLWVLDGGAEPWRPFLSALEGSGRAVSSQLQRYIWAEGFNGIGFAIHSSGLVVKSVGTSVKMLEGAEIAFAAFVLESFGVSSLIRK